MFVKQAQASSAFVASTLPSSAFVVSALPSSAFIRANPEPDEQFPTDTPMSIDIEGFDLTTSPLSTMGTISFVTLPLLVKHGEKSLVTLSSATGQFVLYGIDGLSVGRSYTFIGYSYHYTGGAEHILKLLNDDNNVYGSPSSNDTENTWIEWEYIFTTTSPKLWIHMEQSASGAYIIWDKFSLKETNN